MVPMNQQSDKPFSRTYDHRIPGRGVGSFLAPYESSADKTSLRREIADLGFLLPFRWNLDRILLCPKPGRRARQRSARDGLTTLSCAPVTDEASIGKADAAITGWI